MEGEEEPLEVMDLLEGLGSSGGFAELKRRLARAEVKNAPEEPPLSRPQAERVRTYVYVTVTEVPWKLQLVTGHFPTILLRFVMFVHNTVKPLLTDTPRYGHTPYSGQFTEHGLLSLWK